MGSRRISGSKYTRPLTGPFAPRYTSAARNNIAASRGRRNGEEERQRLLHENMHQGSTATHRGKGSKKVLVLRSAFYIFRARARVCARCRDEIQKRRGARTRPNKENRKLREKKRKEKEGSKPASWSVRKRKILEAARAPKWREYRRKGWSGYIGLSTTDLSD